jgi:hypothetical protein
MERYSGNIYILKCVKKEDKEEEEDNEWMNE